MTNKSEPNTNDVQGYFRTNEKNWLGTTLLAIWITVTLFGIGSLSVGHMVAMPKPKDETRFVQTMLKLRQNPAKDFLVHVIYADCSCTQRLFTHLLERGPFSETEEIVLFAGEDQVKQQLAQQAGFTFIRVSAAELSTRYGMDAAPILAAFNTAGQLRYVGGYYNHPSAIFPLDEKIHLQLTKGASPETLPVFGCAVSARLQKSIDPLGVVYTPKE